MGIQDFQVKEGVLPEEMVIKEEGEVMMILTLVMMGMGMIFPPPQTPLSQGKENRKDLNMFMYSKDLQVQKVKKVNLDQQEEIGLGLENSFDQFGRTIFEVLSAQQRTNQKLEEQFCRANETQEYQAEAMQDMAQANFQMKYDHMFAGVPMYDGIDPDSFDDWLYQIESLCELSHRDVRVELMG